MTTKGTGSIKVPKFDRSEYGLWKMKMRLFIKASNPMYEDILLNGPFIPKTSVPASVDAAGVRTPATSIIKDPEQFSVADKECVTLDTGLMMIIADSADKEMSYQIMNCVSGKHMWDTIELLMEGTAEVRENRLDILTSQYEAFKSLPGESITQVFERFSKLLNELGMKGKTYPLRESNRKFMLTLPLHVEHRATSIRERADFPTMSLEQLFGKLRTYEMEQDQRAIIYGPGSVDSKSNALAKTTALVVLEPITSDVKVETSKAGKEELIEVEIDKVDQEADDSEYYTLDELEQMEDGSMAYMAAKFSHIRFKRNPKYKFKGSSANRFPRKDSYSGSSSGRGYRSNMIDRSKSICYNCSEPGHFASDCKKPRQMRDRQFSYEKKDSYEDLKKENARLKNKMSSMVAEHKGRAYIAEGKNWDDTDSDNEELHVNFALMADTSEKSSSESQVPTLSTLDKSTVQDLNAELFYVRTSMVITERINGDLVLKNKNLESKNEELERAAVNTEDLKQKIEFLENEVKVDAKAETILRSQISDLEFKVNAYKHSSFIAKDIIDHRTIEKKVAIGFDYGKLVQNRPMETPVISGFVTEKVPYVLQNVESPSFSKPIAEPFSESDLIIRQELQVEALEDKVERINNKSPRKSIKLIKPKTDKGDKVVNSNASRNLCNNCNSAGHLTKSTKNVKSKKVVPNKPVKVEETDSSLTTGLGVKKVNNNNTSNMPIIESSHKACGVVNCMSCAFNVMTAYFNGNHACANKTAPRQQVNRNKNVRSKTASPPQVRRETFVPKPKQSVIKAVYKVKCPVNEKNVIVGKKTWIPKIKQKIVKSVYRVKCLLNKGDIGGRIINVVLPNKGQYFKSAGPNQRWVPKKSA
jgi:hypothetical protein